MTAVKSRAMPRTAHPTPNCPAPQVLQFKPVVWTNGPDSGSFLPIPGDPDGGVFWINNKSEMVGASGACAAFDPRYGLPLAPKHALLWRKGLPPVNLGNLGGKINNAAFAMNDNEQVVGTSDLPGDNYQHAFLWQNGAMSDLGTLPGDIISVGCGINNRGQVTGVSADSGGNLRAYLWQDGVMTDLNTLIPPNSPLYLMHAFSINSRGRDRGLCLADQHRRDSCLPGDSGEFRGRCRKCFVSGWRCSSKGRSAGKGSPAASAVGALAPICSTDLESTIRCQFEVANLFEKGRAIVLPLFFCSALGELTDEIPSTGCRRLAVQLRGAPVIVGW